MSSNLTLSFVTGRDQSGRPLGYESLQVPVPFGFGGGSIPIPLPIASGGTNNITPLTNGKIMVSLGDKIVEGTDSSTPVFNSAVLTALSNEAVNLYKDSLVYIDSTGNLYKGFNVDQLVQSRTNIEGSVVMFDGTNIGQSSLIQTDGISNSITLGNSLTNVFVPGKLTVVDTEIITNLSVSGSLTSPSLNILSNTSLNVTTTISGLLNLSIANHSSYSPTDLSLFIDLFGNAFSAPNLENTILSRATDEGVVLVFGTTNNLVAGSAVLSTSSSSVDVKTKLSVFGDIKSTGDLFITNANVLNNLNVNGITTLTGAVTMQNGATVSTSLAVLGALSVTSSFSNNGTSSLSGLVTMQNGATIYSPIKMPSLPVASKSYVLYYDTATKDVSTYPLLVGAYSEGGVLIAGPGSLIYQSLVLNTTSTSVDITADLNITGIASIGGWASGLYQFQTNFTASTGINYFLPDQLIGANITPVTSNNIGVPDGVSTFGFVLNSVGWFDYEFILQSTVGISGGSLDLMALLTDTGISTIIQQNEASYTSGNYFPCRGSFYNTTAGYMIVFTLFNGTANPITFGNAFPAPSYRSYISIKQTNTV